MSQSKKKILKYKITNITENKVILSSQTKKATLEWLETKLSEIDESTHLKFAKVIYGDEIANSDFNPVVIKTVNEIAVQERLKKMLKKELPFQDGTYRVEVDD